MFLSIVAHTGGATPELASSLVLLNDSAISMTSPMKTGFHTGPDKKASTFSLGNQEPGNSTKERNNSAARASANL